MIQFKFNIKHFIYFTFAFILFTIIGTLTHEYGHILVAKSLGYKTTLHYGSMNYNNKEALRNLDLFYSLNEGKIKSENSSNEKKEFKNILKENRKKGFWITVGGPTQTIITGFFGLFILSFRKKDNSFKFMDWLAVFFSLFWLREVFNLVTGLIHGLFLNGNYFGGDEYGISNYLGVPVGTFSIILGIIGLFISIYIVFKIIPKKIQFTFILSGLVGGLSGFYVWFLILGPKLLP